MYVYVHDSKATMCMFLCLHASQMLEEISDFCGCFLIPISINHKIYYTHYTESFVV